jgi:hypothetical protein
VAMQAAGQSLNETLNFGFAAIMAIGALTGGYLLGRYARMQDATCIAQHALDRAARDVRLMREQRWGVVPLSPPARALQEAEHLLWWRANPENMDASPTGQSRMRPPDVPRSEWTRRQREQAAQRSLILALGYQAKRPDDTYAGPMKNVVHARYNGTRTNARRTI